MSLFRLISRIRTDDGSEREQEPGDEAVAAGAIFGAVSHEHARHEADELFAIFGPSMGEDEARALIAKIHTCQSRAAGNASMTRR